MNETKRTVQGSGRTVEHFASHPFRVHTTFQSFLACSDVFTLGSIQTMPKCGDWHVALSVWTLARKSGNDVLTPFFATGSFAKAKYLP